VHSDLTGRNDTANHERENTMLKRYKVIFGTQGNWSTMYTAAESADQAEAIALALNPGATEASADLAKRGN
jgi:hypothetical protein